MSDTNKTEDFKRRTRQIGIDVLQLVDTFPKSIGASVVARQLASSATSIGANYRAVCLARSTNDMVAKLHIVEEESDETAHWLGVAYEVGYASSELARSLEKEAKEILSMTVASIRTLKRRKTQ